jgi:hypothetical protein
MTTFLLFIIDLLARMLKVLAYNKIKMKPSKITKEERMKISKLELITLNNKAKLLVMPLVKQITDYLLKPLLKSLHFTTMELFLV